MKIASYEATTLLVPEDDPLANMPEEAGRKRPIVILLNCFVCRKFSKRAA